MKKRGRPKLDDPRANRIVLRLDSKERSMIDELHDDAGVSRAEIARRALMYYYDKTMKGE